MQSIGFWVTAFSLSRSWQRRPEVLIHTINVSNHGPLLYRYVHLSAGELLRQERASGSSDGQLIDEYIAEGRIVPVAISLALLRKAMETREPHSRFLIDGFPRNRDNLEASTQAAHLSSLKCT